MAWYCISFGLIARYHTVMYCCYSAPANYRVVHLVILQFVKCSVDFAVWTALHCVTRCTLCFLQCAMQLYTVCFGIIMHGFCNCVLWILQFCIVDFAIEQLRQRRRCNRRYLRSSTLGHTMMLVLLSDGVVLRQTWKIYTVCSSSSSEDIFKHSWSHNAMMLVLSDGAWGPQNWWWWWKWWW